MGRTSAWLAAGLLLSVLILAPQPVRARELVADESVEFRFATTAGPVPQWRATRTALHRLAPSLDTWIRLRGVAGPREAWAGDRLSLGLRSGHGLADLAATLTRLGLRVDRQPGERLWILQAPDPWSAARAAQELARHGAVEVAVPVLRRAVALHGTYGPRPLDPFFTSQWHLENRDSRGLPLGPDTNPRAAWPISQGKGVLVAICDSGFEVAHPDLTAQAAGAAHYDFTRNRLGTAAYLPHGTSVAGLAAATANNSIGVAGLAPAAGLLNLVIFDAFANIVSEERLMDMYQYRPQEVGVQNHSWGNADVTLSQPGPLEEVGVANAISLGRGGRGVVMVRSGGNERTITGNANHDGAANDPRVIAVAAVRRDGRVANYSNPGACILVGAPSGDQDDPFAPTDLVLTTDQEGSRGYNATTGTGDSANYTLGDTGFTGTSASAPQVAGLAALVLAANTNLTYRDVQQVLLHAARHPDRADPDVRRNGAGYWVSDNQGFGIPDAGQAVRLAQGWSNRPPLRTVSQATNLSLQVPDDGLRVRVTGTNGVERSLRCESSLGVHTDDPTPRLPLVFVGQATNALEVDLSGRAALIERGTNFFRDKLAFAADAGAAFAVIFNHVDGDEIFTPGGTDFAAIPAVMISENEGRALVARLAAGETIQSSLTLETARQEFTVTNTLVCEHVGLRVRASHGRRGDLRLTLVSPAGTRSVLQRLNDDTEPGPDDWTYWSVQHFYESSAGIWTVQCADEAPDVTGSLLELQLLIRGVAIEDTDTDGLADGWERDVFGSLAEAALGDPDGDGLTNAREQALGTNPRTNDQPLRLEVASYDPGRLLRLSWPALDGTEYRILAASRVGEVPTEIGRVVGWFPEADLVVPLDRTTNQFLWIETP